MPTHETDPLHLELETHLRVAGEEIEGVVLLNFKEMQTIPLENVSVYFEGSVFTCVPSVL